MGAARSAAASRSAMTPGDRLVGATGDGPASMTGDGPAGATGDGPVAATGEGPVGVTGGPPAVSIGDGPVGAAGDRVVGVTSDGSTWVVAGGKAVAARAGSSTEAAVLSTGGEIRSRTRATRGSSWCEPKLPMISHSAVAAIAIPASPKATRYRGRLVCDLVIFSPSP